MAPSDYELRGSLISELLTLDELSYVALNELSYMAPSDSELCGSLISELLALDELSYMAPSDSELRGSLIFELLGFFVFLPLGKCVYF